MKKILILIILIFATHAIAGDYMLYVSNDYYATCMDEARKFHEWCNENKKQGGNCQIENFRPIKTATEVSDSLVKYFNGQEPEIKFLKAAFGNGHIQFCGTDEVEQVYGTLVEIKNEGATKNKVHLNDFILKIKELR